MDPVGSDRNNIQNKENTHFSQHPTAPSLKQSAFLVKERQHTTSLRKYKSQNHFLDLIRL